MILPGQTRCNLLLFRNKINAQLRLGLSNSAGHKSVLAIRREDQSVWERRAPLAPQHVRELVKMGVRVLVQPSNRRGYTMGEYQGAGAVIQEDLSEASVILGVKQVPIDYLLPNKTYAFFSHTIKAQPANMPLLDALLEKKIRLMDYERMVDDNNQRLVAFGQYAGVAGMINILHGLGLRLLALGHHTPFMHIGLPHNYRNSEMAKASIRDAGYEIARGRMPASIGPLTFVFTGTGNVSRGAQDVFQELPHEYIEPSSLSRVAQHGSTKKVYGCVITKSDYLVRKSDVSAIGANSSSAGVQQQAVAFDNEEFEKHPERYASVFATKYAPHASVIVNGIFWTLKMPRLISLAEAKALLRPSPMPWIAERPGCPRLPHRLIALCDISADPGGSIQFMQECTSIDQPFVLYDADQHAQAGTFAGPGVLICSVDNMPTQLPREATDFFGLQLLPYVPELLKSDATAPFEAYKAPNSVKRAIITSNGQLTDNFKYIADLRAARRRQQLSTESGSTASNTSGGMTGAVGSGAARGRRVLILGAGFVAGPAADYIAKGSRDTRVTVASQFMDEASRLASLNPAIEPLLLNVSERPDELERAIQNHDIILSLLPAPYHPQVGRLCVRYKRHMVTSSYVSPEMQALDKPAREAGVTLLNEIGLDPGIDHLLAAKCLDELKEAGARVESFVSWCGGLPAPECSDNPLRYKFSWAPRNVIANLLLGARWLQNGEVKQVGEGGAILGAVTELKFLPGLALEGLPNRDSLRYSSIYNLGQSAHTCLRGTIRYRGFAHAAKALIRVGLASDKPHPRLHPAAPEITWRRLLAELCGRDPDMFEDSLRTLLLEQYLGGDVSLLRVLLDLGLLDDTVPVEKRATPLDSLSNYLAKRLAIGPGDRDLCILRHDISALTLTGQREVHSFTLTLYGGIVSPSTSSQPVQPITGKQAPPPQAAPSTATPQTAMARCVGTSAGIATRILLDGELERRGVVLPVTADLYCPLLARLALEGIEAREVVTVSKT